MSDDPSSSDHFGLIRSGPARVYIDGEELNGGIKSMRWDGEKLVAEVDAKVFGSLEQPPPALAVASIEVPRRVIRSGTLPVQLPSVPLRTRAWCALWHGHWPSHQGLFDFALDNWSCRCGKVSIPAEELLTLSERYSRRPPFG